MRRYKRCSSHHNPSHVDRKEAVAADEVRQRISQQHQGDRQAGYNPSYSSRRRFTAALRVGPCHSRLVRQSHLANEQDRQPCSGHLRINQRAIQRDRQKNRHRVVAAGFELEQRPQPVGESHIARSKHSEDGCSVGGGHNRSQQEPCSRGHPRTRAATKPRSPPVMTTPTVASAKPGERTGRTSSHRVSRPPPKRMNASATMPRTGRDAGSRTRYRQGRPNPRTFRPRGTTAVPAPRIDSTPCLRERLRARAPRPKKQ